eukprot:Sspe_Gene.28373::Locus_12822_Transcript_1_1_Confidence_1.000_Length_1030::g.28373::m.28373
MRFEALAALEAGGEGSGWEAGVLQLLRELALDTSWWRRRWRQRASGVRSVAGQPGSIHRRRCGEEGLSPPLSFGVGGKGRAPTALSCSPIQHTKPSCSTIPSQPLFLALPNEVQ